MAANRELTGRTPAFFGSGTPSPQGLRAPYITGASIDIAGGVDKYR